MKAVIIGASSEALHTIEKAKEENILVCALDGNPKAEGLKTADEAQVVDISNEEKTIEAVKKAATDFVLTVPIGRYLTTIGAVNDALHLPGISKESAVLCTDKWKFHKVLSSRGLRNCNCYKVESERGEREKLYKELTFYADPTNVQNNTINLSTLKLNFPAILKPRFGSGSRGIHFVNDWEELQKSLLSTAEEPYVLEECVQGEEYGVDGAFIQGRFHMVLLRKKENTPLPARQAVAYFSVMPEESFDKEVKEFLEKLGKALNLQECLFHADIIRSKQGPFVIECSARPSGHNLHNLFTPLCTGVDVAKEYIRYRKGEDFSFEPRETRKMMIHYFDICGKVLTVPTEDEVKEKLGESLVKWNCTIQKGQELGNVCDGHSLMNRGFFIVKGNSIEELKKTAEMVKALFTIQTPTI